MCFNYLRGALNGNSVFSYERYLTPLLSVQAEIGFTYLSLSENISLGIFDEKLSFYSPFKLGYSTGAGLRIYPKKQEMDGFYINPAYRYVRYNFQVSDSDLGETYERIHLNDTYVTVGYQLHIRRISLDYYTGGGVRFAHKSSQQSSGNSLTTEHYKSLIPLIAFGFRIGYYF